MKQRLIELETKVAFQDEAIEQLSNCINAQQQQLVQLQQTIRDLKLLLEQQHTAAQGGEIDETPPHY